MSTFIKRFLPVVLIIAMVAIFLFIATRSSDLQVYNTDTGSSTYTITTESPAEIQTEAQLKNPTLYQNSNVAFSMQIPTDWEYVLKDGYDTYIHSASASSIQIQVLSYYPMVNNMTYDTMYETYAESGYTMTEFSYLANNIYYDIYQSYVNSGVYDTIEEVVWDRQHVVKVVVCFDDANYERLQDDIWASINSMYWEYEDPIDSDLYLSYQPFGDFEIAVPMDWYTATTENSYYAYDETTGANMTATVFTDTIMASEISEVDYANYLSTGLDSFVLSNFQQTDDCLHGEGTYYENGIQCVVIQDYITNGTYQYSITWKYPMAYSETYLDIARRALDYTRVFYVPETILNESENTNELYTVEPEQIESSTEATNNTVFIPQQIETNAEYNVQSEAIAEAGSVIGTQEASNNTEQAGSFSDALITVAGISYDQAYYIENIWNIYVGTIVTYVEGYAENSNDLIVHATDSNGTNFYIYISLMTGDLDGIYVNDMYGDVVFLP